MQILEIIGVVLGNDTKQSRYSYCYSSLCLKSNIVDLGIISLGKKMRQGLWVYNSSDKWLAFRLCTLPQDLINIKMQDVRVPPKLEQKIMFDVEVLSENYGGIDSDAILIVNGEAVSKVGFKGSLQVESDPSFVLKVDYRKITKARRKGKITVTLKHKSVVGSKTAFPVYVYTNSPKSPMIKLMVIGTVQ